MTLIFRMWRHDSSGETEAGTTQRDVVRTGVISIAVFLFPLSG